MLVMSRVANKLALEKGNIDEGGVEVDELEDEHLEGEVVIKVWLCSVHFCNEVEHISQLSIILKTKVLTPVGQF